jgi:hypothetical protein
VRIRYQGKDEPLGIALVDFFSQRLIKRAETGRERAARGTTADDPSPALAPALSLNQAIVTGSARSAFRPAKLTPALITFLLLTAIYLAAIALKELANAAFKSERQMARYLGVRVLGTLIDADRLSTNSQSPAH